MYIDIVAVFQKRPISIGRPLVEKQNYAHTFTLNLCQGGFAPDRGIISCANRCKLPCTAFQKVVGPDEFRPFVIREAI